MGRSPGLFPCRHMRVRNRYSSVPKSAISYLCTDVPTCSSPLLVYIHGQVERQRRNSSDSRVPSSSKCTILVKIRRKMESASSGQSNTRVMTLYIKHRLFVDLQSAGESGDNSSSPVEPSLTTNTSTSA